MKSIDRVAAVFGLLGVLAGALGAHGGVSAKVAEMGHAAEWDTAVLYHLVHAVAAWAAARLGMPRVAIVFLVGIVLFSGSLYVLSLTGISKLGAVTPLGGLAMMVGWGMAALRRDSTG